MKLRPNFLSAAAGLFYLTISATAASSAWQREQTLQVSSNGLMRMNLPVETIDSARPGLADLRILDPSGVEMPYWIVHPVPARRWVQPAESFRVNLHSRESIITIETIR